jgi:hypothetical protein
MTRCRIAGLVLGVLFALPAATSLFAQEPYVGTRPPGRHPDVAANPGAEDMYVPPKAGQPFTGKSTVQWTSPDGSQTHFAFMSMLARESSGKLYFESRRRVNQSGEIQPRWNFTIIDPKEKTRTICYTATKTCRMNAFRRIVYEDSANVEDLGRATTMEKADLGTSVLDALTVVGIRETTSVAAGAYNNSNPLLITREVWHSPELDLDVAVTKSDPRSGTFARKIEILSRTEPDPDYFTIPKDYTILDNRPQKKKTD